MSTANPPGWFGEGKYRWFNTLPAAAFMNNNFNQRQKAKAWSIQGFEDIMRNLNIEILAITKGSARGLIEVSKVIRRDMDANQPYIPMDTGNLRASWETFPIIENKKHGLMMGFSANYALWVHEMYDRPVNWTIPGSGPKFLEAAVNRNRDKILQIVADKCNENRKKGKKP